MARREGIQLCVPFEEKRLAGWAPPWIIQPKLDGVRCRAILEPGKVTLLSSEGNEILSVPHINRQLSSVGLEVGLELDGELYTHGLPFEEIFSRTSRGTNLHPQSGEIEYHIFDLVENERQDLRLMDLISKVQEPISRLLNSSLHVVRIKVVSSLSEIMDQYETYLKMGYEGFILRHIQAPYIRRRSTYVMKFKPKKVDIYRIAGVIEEYDQFGSPKNSLGSIACTSDDQTFYVGTGFTRDERESLWKIRESLPGLYLEVAYQHLTAERGVPRFPVFKSILNPSEVLTAPENLNPTFGRDTQVEHSVGYEDDGYAD